MLGRRMHETTSASDTVFESRRRFSWMRPELARCGGIRSDHRHRDSSARLGNDRCVRGQFGAPVVSSPAARRARHAPLRFVADRTRRGCHSARLDRIGNLGRKAASAAVRLEWQIADPHASRRRA